MKFDESLVSNIANNFLIKDSGESGLETSFIEICRFLNDNPDTFSSKKKFDFTDEKLIQILAKKFFSAYRHSDFPVEPTTIPDDMVSIVMQFAYGYSLDDSTRIKIEHKHSMSAENCVGALLERYIDSILRKEGWHWCCGSFVKAVDFISMDKNGLWLALQVKNRDNTENSSSSAIRNGTEIQKWFRSFSKKGGTNWDKFPVVLKNKNLTEEGFVNFVSTYLQKEKARLKR